MKQAILELLQIKIKSRKELDKEKRKIAKKYNLAILANAEIFKVYQELVKNKKTKINLILENILKKRAIRTLSGIAPVAVLVEPFGCPANCAYCPTEDKVPKSYLANEPAVMRAIRCKYDPYLQVQTRLAALEANGHKPEKIELIVIGGTWSALPIEYKYWYIANCFLAANNYPKKNKIISRKLKLENLKIKLNQEQEKNEKAKYKIIGITLETRPDWINAEELKQMRELGCTRVELGAQIPDDAVLLKNNRGHGVAEITAATKLLKDWGFKITYHFMPGLPGSNAKNDLAKFKLLFSSEDFQPDQLKFYPTVVIKNSLLYEWWEAGEYKPYSLKVLENLILKAKKAVPPYVRIVRLIRDIPANSIVAGNIITNLRQILERRGIQCRCIRCREAHELEAKDCELSIIKYKASDGEEYFLSFESENKKTLYGFCRLRLPSQESPFADAALIRELHVYGELSPIGESKNIQHLGLGKKLLTAAEQIAPILGFKKIAIISGVGVRDYYRKLGYRLNNTYMVKSL